MNAIRSSCSPKHRAQQTASMVRETSTREKAFGIEYLSALISVLRYIGEAFILRGGDVQNCSLWVDSGNQRAWSEPAVGKNQEGHDRQAFEAYRAGGKKEGPDPLPARDILWPLFLRRTKQTLVRAEIR